MLREAVRADIAGAQRVRRAVRENRLVSGVITDEEVREHLESFGRGWVVETGGEVVGFAIVNARTCNIWALFMDPGHERRGHGRRLHDTMLAWAWAQGLPSLWLSTGPQTRAEGFYAAAGWRRAGVTEHGEVRFEMTRP